MPEAMGIEIESRRDHMKPVTKLSITTNGTLAASVCIGFVMVILWLSSADF